MAEYITSDEMDTYAADRPGSEAWGTATAATKADLLAYVSKLVDSLPFVGKKYETDISTQPLQWPRKIKVRGGWRIADQDSSNNAVVPQAVKDAVCEEILARLDTAHDERRALQEGGVVAYKLSDLSETYGGSGGFQCGGIRGTPLRSWTAYRLLELYLTAGARAI